MNHVKPLKMLRDRLTLSCFWQWQHFRECARRGCRDRICQSPVTSLTAEQTAKIFLGKTNNFPDDRDAVPIDQAVGSPIREEFYAKVAHKNPSQLSAYWARVIFTGDGRPPAMLDSNAAVRKAVASNPNAIGYIDKSAVNKSVRVILAP